ncbi:PQQ-like beta-propeller repeat protein [Streptomyces sp. ISL-36]|nr:PQQ-like beta-propeller repeat protein [Streptomyces sp. ISL-36]
MTVSGGKIYLGTYIDPSLYRFDPATGKVVHLKTFGGEGGFIWSLATAPDGVVYAGTYPSGRVWEYNPATGAAQDFGVLSTGERYVRAVAADATNVYAGLLDSGKLLAINRSTRTTRVLATNAGGFSTVSIGRTRVRAGSGSQLFDVKTDGTDLRKVDLGAGRSVDSIGLAADYSAYVSTRPNGLVARYRTAEPLKWYPAPKAGEETRGLFLDGTTLTGFSGSGGVWQMDVDTEQSTYTDLLKAGLSEGSERPQSILRAADGKVWVGGHFNVTVHDPVAPTKRTVWVPGEPKALVQRGEKIYAAIYPSGRIVEIDPTRDDAVRELAFLPSGQQRPWDMEYDLATDRLLVAPAPLGTSTVGALTVVDPVTGTTEPYVNVLPNESLMSLSLGPDGIVYLGGDVRGGGGGDPAQWNSAAGVGAFDLNAKKLLWETDPVAGNQTVQDIKVHNGVLYGVFKRNAGWFTMNPQTRQVLDRGTLPGYGEIEVHQDKVFTSTYFDGGKVHLLGPGLTDPQVIATGLGDEWYTNPQLAFEPGSWNGWALVGRDLSRLRLDPACPPLTVTS